MIAPKSESASVHTTSALRSEPKFVISTSQYTTNPPDQPQIAAGDPQVRPAYDCPTCQDTGQVEVFRAVQTYRDGHQVGTGGMIRISCPDCHGNPVQSAWVIRRRELRRKVAAAREAAQQSAPAAPAIPDAPANTAGTVAPALTPILPRIWTDLSPQAQVALARLYLARRDGTGWLPLADIEQMPRRQLLGTVGMVLAFLNRNSEYKISALGVEIVESALAAGVAVFGEEGCR